MVAKNIPAADLDLLQNQIEFIQNNSSVEEMPERDIPLLCLTPPMEGFPSDDDPVKFCTVVKGWLRYKMAKKYCRKFQTPE